MAIEQHLAPKLRPLAGVCALMTLIALPATVEAQCYPVDPLSFPNLNYCDPDQLYGRNIKFGYREVRNEVQPAGDESQGEDIARQAIRGIRVEAGEGVGPNVVSIASVAGNSFGTDEEELVEQLAAGTKHYLDFETGGGQLGCIAGVCPYDGNPGSFEMPKDAMPRDPTAPDNVAAQGPEGPTDPVNLFNGELVVTEVDLSFPAPGISYQHVRTYRSRVTYDGPHGFNWDHMLNQRIAVAPGSDCGTEVILQTGNARTLRFRGTRIFDETTGTARTELRAEPRTEVLVREEILKGGGGGGVFVPFPGGNPAEGDFTTTGWTLYRLDGSKTFFNQRGLATRMEDANGVGLDLVWESSTFVYGWRIKNVTDATGRTIDYSYGSDGRLERIEESVSGLSAEFAYDNRGDLVSYRSADGRSERYSYEVSLPPSTSVEISPANEGPPLSGGGLAA